MGNEMTRIRLKLQKNKARHGVADTEQASSVERVHILEMANTDAEPHPLDQAENSSSVKDCSSEESQEDIKLQHERKSLEDFNLLCVLGRGTFGKVILSELKGTDEVYALKIIKKDTIREFNMISYALMERRILTLASEHPYLTHLFCSFQTDDSLCFAMEYLNGGDLAFHMLQGFDECCTQFYAAEIACALMFLHQNGIIHRDIKPENILLDADGHCKIADFGICMDGIVDGKMAKTFWGTPNYKSPEMIQYWEYGTSVDWWALGVIMYEMMTGCDPFHDDNEQKMYDYIVNAEPHYPSNLSIEAISILKAFLEKNPKNRLGCVKSQGKENGIKVHPFFKNINWVLLEQRKIPPPFKPQIMSKRDICNFLKGSTCEDPELPHGELSFFNQSSQEQFKGFSFTNTKVL
ncbi:protein kinase C epsilon type-like [Tachysurus fulvidraco]|uniref:protein kinase C epsilon type-like n=1 Tax=Tachysurus fulvidraco TaxID=1234273 RepID=UPI000F50194D|nr:protein kinase C epsilon type-like [Tachysurus fulvidraco]